jgi:hypothetical protein
MTRTHRYSQHKLKQLLDASRALTELSTAAEIAARHLRIEDRIATELSLSRGERDRLALLNNLEADLKQRLLQQGDDWQIAEAATLLRVLAADLPAAHPDNQEQLQAIGTRLAECLHANLVMPERPSQENRPPAAGRLLQFKITLLDVAPPIWRRIQIRNCTLDKLHEHIQTAMGWSNSHLHQFRVGAQLYGDPWLMEELMDEMTILDSTATRLSEILPSSAERFRFLYEYDFGDCWEHEVLYEGRLQADRRQKYPLCLEGERACPPEDCGGPGGYEAFLEAIRNPRHQEHDAMLARAGGSFDPEFFDPEQATRAMKEGLPDWRNMD